MKYLKDGWLILLLAIVFGSGLAYINAALNDQINANKKNETYNQLPALLLGAQAVDTSKTVVEGINVTAKDSAGKVVAKYRVWEQSVKGAKGIYTVYVCYKEKESKPCGFVVKSKGNGFADTIEALIGVNARVEKITGIYVLDQKETPGLGDKITSDWKNQYQGKAADGNLKVGKKLNEEQKKTQIDAISGATISSDSLTKIVNSAINTLKTDLTAGKIGPGADKEAK